VNETASHVAREALDLARKVEMRVDGHEDICAERYKRLEENISNVKSETGDIKKILAWAGTTGFAVILAVLGFLLKLQVDANTDMQKAVQNLQQQQTVYERPE